jgi:GNAT superfamily N-acetyltransferase
MQRCDYVEGKGFVLRGAQGGRSDNHCDVYFVDSPDRISLVARVRGKAVRLEGEMGNVARKELIDWCRGFAPENVETTHEALKDCLSEIVGTERWRMNGTYTATRESFRQRITAHVRRLSPDDRPMWQRFVERHGHEPQVNARGGSQAVVRDFEFMCLGLPVNYYVTKDGEDITGVLAVNSFTDRCDEISTLFVDPAHRRKGLAHSLLSVATREVFARGKQPAYSAAGNREELGWMLEGIGYSLVCSSWYWWA